MTQPQLAAKSEELLHTIEDLLRDAGMQTIEDFSADVHDDEDVDTWIRLTSTGVLIETPSGGIELDFPFAWADFWSVVEEVAKTSSRGSMSTSQLDVDGDLS